MAKSSHNPFSALDKSRFPKDERDRRKRRKKQEDREREALRQAAGEEEPASEPGEEDLFLRAMSGVQPLENAGRIVAQPPPPPAKKPAAPQTDEDDAATQLMDLVNGKVEFSLDFTEEYIRAQVKGLDSKIVARLRAGRYSPEAHLDLHGMNSEQAYGALLGFVREHYLLGRRCLLLIPGRGKNSADGYGVLREKAQRWLTRDPFKRVVLAFCTALPKHGGAGALYVLLRRQRKTQGKIVWDRMPGEEDI